METSFYRTDPWKETRGSHFCSRCKAEWIQN